MFCLLLFQAVWLVASRFVPRRFVPRLSRFVPTFGQFIPNRLVDSYPTNYDIKFLEFLSEKLVKTIKKQRSHAQGICVILFVILLNFT